MSNTPLIIFDTDDSGRDVWVQRGERFFNIDGNSCDVDELLKKQPAFQAINLGSMA